MLTWLCNGCIADITGVYMLLLWIGNLEANFDYLERRVQMIEKEHVQTTENKDMNKEGVGF